MSTFHNSAYAVGFTPWEKPGQADGDRIAWLFEREEVDRLGPGKALDHGLDAQNRRAMARSVTARATSEATLVMLAFGKPVGPPFMPTGAKRSDIEEAYVDWAVVDVLKPPTDTSGLPKIARSSEPTLYRLARR